MACDESLSTVASAESQPSYSKILEWSLAKLTVQNTVRRRTSIDLRRSVLIAATVTKARAGIIRQKAMEFLEARPQLQPPTGYHHHHQQYHHQQKVQPAPIIASLTIPEVQPDIEMDEDDEPSERSAFGYSASLLPSDGEDPLSASAEAIVMSAVEISMEGQQQQQQRCRQLPSVAPSAAAVVIPVACRQQAWQLNSAMVPWHLPECHSFA